MGGQKARVKNALHNLWRAPIGNWYQDFRISIVEAGTCNMTYDLVSKNQIEIPNFSILMFQQQSWVRFSASESQNVFGKKFSIWEIHYMAVLKS